MGTKTQYADIKRLMNPFLNFFRRLTPKELIKQGHLLWASVIIWDWTPHVIIQVIYFEKLA